MIGQAGVDKRIDVIATAMHFGGTVHDLAQVDLAYAPPFGSAKDPVHMAAFVAENDLLKHPTLMETNAELDGYQIVDVRNQTELDRLPAVPGAGIYRLTNLVIAGKNWIQRDLPSSSVTAASVRTSALVGSVDKAFLKSTT